MKNKLKILTMVLLSTIIFIPVVCNALDPDATPSPTPEVTPTPSPSPSPTPSATPEVVLSSDNYLKSLSVDGFTLNETFSKTTTKYTLTVPSSTTKIVVKAEANDSEKATVSGIGTVTLYSGSSTIVKVSVKAEDSSIKTYTIEVKKEESNLNLQTLKIKGQTLNETFDPEKLEYTMDVEYDIETIAITASAADSKATVTTTGGTVLKVGENIVTVVVKDSYGNKKTYTITVTRKDEEEEQTTTTSTSEETSKEVTDTLTNDKENPIKYVLVTIASLLLITIGGLGIYFYIKTSDPAKKQKKLEKKRQKLLEKANKLNVSNEVKESPLVEVEDKEEIIDSKEDINDQDTLEFQQPTRTSRMARHDDNVLKGIEDLFEDK